AVGGSIKLTRLRYGRSATTWGFALYLASTDKRRDCSGGYRSFVSCTLPRSISRSSASKFAVCALDSVLGRRASAVRLHQ
ncbi:hypothetical protein ACFV3E_46445, partial [Streptomyces sp. NPDC059718]